MDLEASSASKIIKLSKSQWLFALKNETEKISDAAKSK